MSNEESQIMNNVEEGIYEGFLTKPVVIFVLNNNVIFYLWLKHFILKTAYKASRNRKWE